MANNSPNPLLEKRFQRLGLRQQLVQSAVQAIVVYTGPPTRPTDQPARLCR